jgi:thioredoxin reductase (NADPH)
VKQYSTDVLIVGAGPVGLSAVFSLGQIGLRSIVVDALDAIGGQCTALYPEKPIYDIPARMQIAGAALIEELAQQAAPYNPVYLLSRRAIDLTEQNGSFSVAMSDGSVVTCGCIVIAAGVGAFGPNRPPLANIEQFEGRSVHYFVRSAEQFRNKRIVIAGGGDSAADWAVILAEVATSVTLVHRRRAFRAAEATQKKLEELELAGKLIIAAPQSMQSLESENGLLSAVVVKSDDGAQTRISCDALLCFFGLAKDLSALMKWGIGASRNGIPVDYATMQTSRRGIFAIGDVVSYAGKLKLILTGFSEGAVAAHAARAHLFPDRQFHFEYSTTRGRPGIEKVA